MELEISSNPSLDNNDHRNRDHSSSKVRFCWRYVIAVLGFLAMTNSYAMRTLLSVSIVAMVGTSNTTLNSTHDVCGKSDGLVHKGHRGEFDWDQKEQGIVNGAFYYGYIMTQIIGGRLAENYGAKRVIFVGGCLGTLATFIGPLAARVNMGFFIFTRVLCGLGLAVFQPCLHSLIARWAPPHERSVFSAIIYSGNQFGAVLAMLISGVIDQYAPDGGWPWSFYIFGLGLYLVFALDILFMSIRTGIFCFVWLVLWMIFVYVTPAEHPWMSTKERRYIESSLCRSMNAKHAYPMPWKTIFTSRPIWALILCHFGYNWGFYTLLQQIPTYLSNIFGFTLAKNGFLSSLPYLVMMVVGYLSSYAAFQLTKRNILAVVTVRKSLNTLAFFGSAFSLLGITFLTCQTSAIYGLLMLAVIFFGLTYAGFQINHVDLAPNFAGTLEGITNTAAAIPGIISPYVVGVITQGNETEAAWRVVFYIAMAILLLFGTFYLAVGSANLQSWNEPTGNHDKKPFHGVRGVSFRTLS